MSTDRQIKTIKDIINNYSNLEKSIVKQLNFQVLHGPLLEGLEIECRALPLLAVVDKEVLII